MRYLVNDAVLEESAAKPAVAAERRWSPGSWLLPVLGSCWLLVVAGTSVYLLRREFYADRARQLWCDAARCAGLVQPPGDVFGLLLAVVAIAFLVALIAVPHRGSLRTVRVAMLAGLIVASWGAEALLFAPFFSWD